VVCGRPQERGGSLAKVAGAAQPLGRGNGLHAAAIRGEKLEELGRLVVHRANSFCSMNLTCSKFIERNRFLSSKHREKDLSCW
jgi:hypothetical protein